MTTLSLTLSQTDANLLVVWYVINALQVRLQTMPKPAAGQLPVYSSTWDCTRKIFVKEVFRVQDEESDNDLLNTTYTNSHCTMYNGVVTG